VCTKYTRKMSVMIEMIMMHSNDSSTDETLQIKKDYLSNEFTVSFSDPNKYTACSNTTVKNLYHDKLMKYVYMLLKNLKVDEEGPTNIQVNIPGMPSILFSGNKMNDIYYREHLYDLIEFGVDLLEHTTPKINKKPVVNDGFTTPKVSRRSTAPGVVPSHLFFD
jgi:hypothetical protein